MILLRDASKLFMKNLWCTCSVLAKLRHCVPIQILIDVFNALIHSYLRYGIIIWGSTSKDFNLLNLSNVHALEIGKFVYKEKFGYLPTEIGNYFPTSSNFTSHNYGTRVSNSTVPLDRKIVNRLKSSERSVQFKTNHLWSNLQDSFKSLESLNIFKKHYKKYLISEQQS